MGVLVLIAGFVAIVGVIEPIYCVGIPKEFGSEFSGKTGRRLSPVKDGPAGINTASFNEKQMTVKDDQPYVVHGRKSVLGEFRVKTSKGQEVANRAAQKTIDSIDNVGTVITKQKVDTAKHLTDSGGTEATTELTVDNVSIVNDGAIRGNNVNSEQGAGNRGTPATYEKTDSSLSKVNTTNGIYSEQGFINRTSLQGSNEAKIPDEINAVTSHADQETGGLQGLHNIDGHYVLVKRQKKVYTKLFFRSKTKLLMIERTQHDNYKRCTVFENRADEELPKGPNVITIGIEGMAEMLTICKRLNEMRASRTKRFIDIIYPGTKWCGVGNIAESPDDLGRNVEVDKCCRTHDQCPEGIGPFEYKYGLYSTSLFYRSACSCDETFYNCLKAAGDVVIGNIFFNIVSNACIEQVYQEVCIRPGWWWTCREYGIDTTKPKIWVFMENMLIY